MSSLKDCAAARQTERNAREAVRIAMNAVAGWNRWIANDKMHLKDVEDELAKVAPGSSDAGQLEKEKSALLDTIASNTPQRDLEMTKLAAAQHALAKARTALSDCFFIDGIETTQCIQYYRTQLIPNEQDRSTFGDPQPDNSLPLVTGKPTALRAYVYVPNPHALPGIVQRSPTLHGRVSIVLHGRKLTLQASSTKIVNFPNLARSDLGAGLTFAVPKEYCRHNLSARLDVILVPADHKRGDPWSDPQSNAWPRLSEEFMLQFKPIPPVKISVLRVRSPNFPEPPPISELLDNAKLWYAERAARLYPISDVIWDVEPDTYTLPPNSNRDPGRVLSDQIGTIFRPLPDLRTQQRADYRHESILLVVLPYIDEVGFSDGKGAGDPALRAMALTSDYNDVDLAHELGHVLGIAHPTDAVIWPTSDHPAISFYPGYQTSTGPLHGSAIGEYGFDAVSGAIWNPDSADIMVMNQYGRWISPYTYAHALQTLEPGDWMKICDTLPTNMLFNPCM